MDTMNAVPEWVLAACSDAPNRPVLAQPYEFVWHGEPWTFGTTGYVAVLARGSFGAAPLSSTTVPIDADRAFALPPEESRETFPVDLDALREWLGFDVTQPTCTLCKGVGEWKCEDCDGEGEVECECHCGDVHGTTCDGCSGLGMKKCPTCFPSSKENDRGWVFGQYFNRTLLRRALVGLPYREGVWVRDTTSEEKSAHISGDGWHIVIMPLRAGHSHADDPRFESPANV